MEAEFVTMPAITFPGSIQLSPLPSLRFLSTLHVSNWIYVVHFFIRPSDRIPVSQSVSQSRKLLQQPWK